MTDPKNKPGRFKNAARSLRQALFLATACGGLLSSVHAANNEDIFFKLADLCKKEKIGGEFDDAVLEKVRGEKYPSPKTGGFTIDSVEPSWTPTSIFLNGSCLVKGKIHSTSQYRLDPKVKDLWNKGVPDINFELYIPSQWNGKLIQFGGGLFSWPSSVMGSKTAETENYALLMSDAGNTQPLLPFLPNITGFGMAGLVKGANDINDIPQQELATNFGGNSIKKSLDVGVTLVKKITGKTPEAKYFVGFSTGGRQALKAIESWPDAYDGVVSGAPSVYLTRMIKRVGHSHWEEFDTDKFGGVLGGLILGTLKWSDPSATQALGKALGWAVQSISQAAIDSGADKDNAIDKLMNAMEPVWNVKPGAVENFLNTPTNSGKKKKRVILYQGTQDIVVPCTQTGKFVRDSANYVRSKNDEETVKRMGDSTRVYFINGFNHGFFPVTADGGLGDLSWNYISALDQWVHDDNAKPKAPRNSFNPAGNIPTTEELKTWGCSPNDFQ
ncbi:tannase/feruloyl esterase family alpha/beta hydrolase [Variovorax sp. ZS18.2.2]|uniref:tannase/feruloyl esterase family alpha/beta hydrolase n=1 Tax=Variovorax sp. ZS18.2.2 TaxID=2971255 RepID=UPI002150AA5E|nr:tannase/feruloyl esterase family alpha/beta hydrolase [Variovorax sp. ZS18.2.2]MCR6476037.1 tannase/feruloyl esterase family alpha/beta hydrolase [Variovorax sp. ZS18.2.2]